MWVSPEIGNFVIFIAALTLQRTSELLRDEIAQEEVSIMELTFMIQRSYLRALFLWL